MSARRERGQPNQSSQNPEAGTTASGGSTNGMNLSELKEKSIPDLNALARDLNVQNTSGLRKQELIFKILQAQADRKSVV